MGGYDFFLGKKNGRKNKNFGKEQGEKDWNEREVKRLKGFRRKWFWFSLGNKDGKKKKNFGKK